MKENIFSPITGNKSKVIQVLSTKSIIKVYKKAFGFNANYLLAKYKKIYLCQCLETNYKFYYPFDIDGDGKFYEFFQKFDWYYMPWKWEHEISKGFISNDMKVLEIGCAKGDFLKEIYNNKKNLIVEGLELNESAASEAVKAGLNVHVSSIQEFSNMNENKYDIVCSFQVLEHIADPKTFLEAAIKTLKPNGQLIICVPNNDSFIKYDNGGILNLPPHHMGLWGEKSLINITNLFNLKDCKLIHEPLQKYHENWFVFLHIKKYFISNLLSKIIFKIIYICKIEKVILNKINTEIGHSIVAVYRK
jgi:2-polyprenyl-3-methyl-5-hydroxy-6-metoxy-1,4-benzoquinol methylase